MYYASNHSPGYPASILRFDDELSRDEFVSRKPGERRLADEPEDKSGFRHCIADTSAAKPLAGYIKPLEEAVVKP